MDAAGVNVWPNWLIILKPVGYEIISDDVDGWMSGVVKNWVSYIKFFGPLRCEDLWDELAVFDQPDIQ